MNRYRCIPVGMIALSLLMYAPARAAEQKEQGQKFLRFVEEGKFGGRLETAIVTYKNDKGASVQLVGAVHIADSGYYKQLNTTFEGYDALLYEMVKPKGAGAPGKGDGASSVNWVRMLQKGMKTFLELDYQLDGIDYSKKNFVHADLDAETFEKLQEERGESIFGMMLQQMIREMMKGGGKAGAELDPLELLEALSSQDSARQLKLMLAKQFENMDEMVEAMEGPNGSVLLTERNKAAMKVLKDTLAGGKKNIGVFYGAAHMKDLDKRLIDELGFKRTGVEWRVAWDLTPAGGKAAAPANRAGVVDEKDAALDKMQKKIEDLEKKIAEMEKKGK